MKEDNGIVLQADFKKRVIETKCGDFLSFDDFYRFCDEVKHGDKIYNRKG